MHVTVYAVNCRHAHFIVNVMVVGSLVQLFSFATVFALAPLSSAADVQSPILIVPGFLSAQLESKNTSAESCFFCLCDFSTWQGLWVNVYRLTFCRNDVFKHITLKYDSARDTYANGAGVEVRVRTPAFGDTTSVESIVTDPGAHIIPQTQIFKAMVEYFVSKGYERGKTIRAAPYDWRFAAEKLEAMGYYSQVKQLIEEMYAERSQKVTIVAHSMGGPVALYFLNEVVDQAWKDKHVNAFIPIGGAWSGGNEALLDAVSGLNGECPFLFEALLAVDSSLIGKLLTFVRSLESTYWLFPREEVWKNSVIITTPTKNYTSKDFQELFSDLGYPDGYKQFKSISEINLNHDAPNVPVFCFYATGVDTPEMFEYDTDFPLPEKGANIKIMNGKGDQVVHELSARVCLKWKDEQDQYFYSEDFNAVTHSGMVKDMKVIVGIENAINQMTKFGAIGSSANSGFSLVIVFTSILLSTVL